MSLTFKFRAFSWESISMELCFTSGRICDTFMFHATLDLQERVHTSECKKFVPNKMVHRNSVVRAYE